MTRGTWTPDGGWGAYVRTRRQGFVANKKCYECGLRPPKEGRRRCQECADRHVEYREAAINSGQCRELCGQQRADGYSRCNDCLDRHARKQRAARGQDVNAPIVRRPARRKQPLSTSQDPQALPTPAPVVPSPVEVDLSERRRAIAALAARRVA